MTFDDIPAGTAVFVDANTFVYYFEPHHGLTFLASPDADFDRVLGLARYAPV
jgi:hypothetical protein